MISPEEAEAIAERAAHKALRDGLQKFGVDPDAPLEAQKDFAFLREQRLTAEKVSGYVKLTLLGIFLTGAVTVFALGIKDTILSWVHHVPPN